MNSVGNWIFFNVARMLLFKTTDLRYDVQIKVINKYQSSLSPPCALDISVSWMSTTGHVTLTPSRQSTSLSAQSHERYFCNAVDMHIAKHMD
jgi:hypothetical protein